MPTHSRRAYAAVAAAVAVTTALASAPLRAQALRKPIKERDFTVSILHQSQKLTLSKLHGKVVIVDFWATWCRPCQMVTPVLEGLYQQFGSKGLEVLGIDCDDQSTVGVVPQFVKNFNITYPIAASPAADQIAQYTYEVQGLPTTVLIDKRGYIRWAQVGVSDDEQNDLRKVVLKLLAER
ncbi:MAG: TlpA family protein disulfide reductase [Capsulimonadaceae bacterium]